VKTIALILIKLIVQQFYSKNASLFFLMIAFAGGFMRSVDHLALGELFVSSWLLLLIPVTAWVVYTLYTLDFNNELLKKDENRFVFQFRLFPRTRQWYLSFVVAVQQLTPIILYATFLLALALKHHIAFSVICIIGSIVFLIFLLTILLRNSILYPYDEKRTGVLHRFFHRSFSKPYTLLVFEGVLRRQTLALAGYKIVSMLILWAALNLYKSDSYDLRLLGIASTISFSFAISFVLEFHAFENQAFNLFRRMPFSMLERFLSSFLILFLFSLPEGFLLLKNLPDIFNYADISNIYFYGLSIGLFWYSFLYTNDYKSEKIVGYVYLTTIIFFVLILGKASILFLSCINTGAAIFFFFRYYQKFEYVSISDQQTKN
jgi:hypothetical protein